MPNSGVRLDARLAGLRDWVNPGARVIDVGADHGLLGVALLSQHRAEFVIATEREERRAGELRRNARELAGGLRFEIRIGDGLSVLRPADSIDTTIFAGLGPDAIFRALDLRPEGIPPSPHLLLQPQGNAAKARRELCARGYAMTREAWVVVSGRGYPLIAAEAASDPAPEVHPLLDFEALMEVGPRLVEQPTPALVAHWREQERQAARDVGRGEGRPGAGGRRARLTRAGKILEALGELI